MALLEMLHKNGNRFPSVKRRKIMQRIMVKLDEAGREYLQRQALESEYVQYREPSDSNGFKKLDIDKLEAIISYLAEHVRNLYKLRSILKLFAVNISLSSSRKALTAFFSDLIGILMLIPLLP